MYSRAVFQVQAPGGLYLQGRYNGGFLHYRLRGLISRGDYFRNFTVTLGRDVKIEVPQAKTVATDGSNVLTS